MMLEHDAASLVRSVAGWDGHSEWIGDPSLHTFAPSQPHLLVQQHPLALGFVDVAVQCEASVNK